MSLMLSLLLVLSLAAQSTAPYRMLSAIKPESKDAVREFDYSISVEQYLDASAIRNLVCQLIQDQKPDGYDVLSAGVYYKLDRYRPESDEGTSNAAVHREHRIAQYHWSKDSPKDSRRLVVVRDEKGQSLAEWRFYNFDHTKACRTN